MKLQDKWRSKAIISFHTKFDVFLYFQATRKESINIDEFDSFDLNNCTDIINEYATFYWQEYIDTPIPSKSTQTISSLYNSMKEFKDKNGEIILKEESKYVNNFEKVFPFEKFELLFQSAKCHYCNLTEERIAELINKRQIFKKKQDTRGFTLEIDRKDPNLEYTDQNSAMCCYWCNNAKTDEFSELEFMKIGHVIEEIWKERLSKS